MVGRIVTPVIVANALDPSYEIRFEGLVDTGAAGLVLPAAWKEQLGSLHHAHTVEMYTAELRRVTADICGPVQIEIEGFRPIYSEVIFLEMHPVDGCYYPLLGQLVLEQAGIAIDMKRHRLIDAGPLDLRAFAPGGSSASRYGMPPHPALS